MSARDKHLESNRRALKRGAFCLISALSEPCLSPVPRGITPHSIDYSEPSLEAHGFSKVDEPDRQGLPFVHMPGPRVGSSSGTAGEGEEGPSGDAVP